MGISGRLFQKTCLEQEPVWGLEGPSERSAGPCPGTARKNAPHRRPPHPLFGSLFLALQKPSLVPTPSPENPTDALASQHGLVYPATNKRQVRCGVWGEITWRPTTTALIAFHNVPPSPACFRLKTFLPSPGPPDSALAIPKAQLPSSALTGSAQLSLVPRCHH